MLHGDRPSPHTSGSSPLKTVASIRGGAIAPHRSVVAHEEAAKWVRGEPGSGVDRRARRFDEDETEDLEALLQSVTSDSEDTDERPLDLADLANLGDFSGLGPLDFSADEEIPESTERGSAPTAKNGAEDAAWWTQGGQFTPDQAVQQTSGREGPASHIEEGSSSEVETKAAEGPGGEGNTKPDQHEGCALEGDPESNGGTCLGEGERGRGGVGIAEEHAEGTDDSGVREGEESLLVTDGATGTAGQGAEGDGARCGEDEGNDVAGDHGSDGDGDDEGPEVQQEDMVGAGKDDEEDDNDDHDHDDGEDDGDGEDDDDDEEEEGDGDRTSAETAGAIDHKTDGREVGHGRYHDDHGENQQEEHEHTHDDGSQEQRRSAGNSPPKGEAHGGTDGRETTRGRRREGGAEGGDERHEENLGARVDRPRRERERRPSRPKREPAEDGGRRSPSSARRGRRRGRRSRQGVDEPPSAPAARESNRDDALPGPPAPSSDRSSPGAHGGGGTHCDGPARPHESRMSMEDWLDKQRHEPVPAWVPPLRAMSELIEEGYEEEDDGELARKLSDHRNLGARWASTIVDVRGLGRTRNQIVKVLLLQATARIITGGAAPTASPGRERLALAGLALAASTRLVHMTLRRLIEKADFDGALEVETRSVSPLGFLMGKKANTRRVSAREYDLGCLHSIARWGVALLAVGVALSVALRSTEPLFVLSGLAFLRYFAEPIFFLHAMENGVRVAGARRPFTPPSPLNALIGCPYGASSSVSNAGA